MWTRKVDRGRRVRVVTLTIKKARLETDDVVAEGIVLSLDGTVLVGHFLKLVDLVLERLDVFLLALAKGALRRVSQYVDVVGGARAPGQRGSGRRASRWTARDDPWDRDPTRSSGRRLRRLHSSGILVEQWRGRGRREHEGPGRATGGQE